MGLGKVHSHALIADIGFFSHCLENTQETENHVFTLVLFLNSCGQL